MAPLAETDVAGILGGKEKNFLLVKNLMTIGVLIFPILKKALILSNFNLPSQKNSSPSIAMKDKPTTTIADIIYEIILISPIWGIGLVAGWNEISKFIDTL